MLYYIDHIVESRTLKAQYIGMYIVLSLMAKCKKLTLCSDPSFAYLTCVHIRHIGSSNFEKFFLFVYSPYYLRVWCNIVMQVTRGTTQKYKHFTSPALEFNAPWLPIKTEVWPRRSQLLVDAQTANNLCHYLSRPKNITAIHLTWIPNDYIHSCES